MNSPKPDSETLKIAAVYAAAASVALLVSNRLPAAIARSTADRFLLRALFDAAFVLCSTGLLHRTLRSHCARRDAALDSLRKLSHAVENSPAAIVITDTKGRIEYVNRKFTDITGYPREEALGKNPRILKSGEIPPDEYAKMWATISSGGDWHGEFLNRAKDGKLFREWASISPIRGDDGRITHYIAVKEDITERRTLEGQLRQSQKMEMIGTLAGGIAHDFNNILTVIQGHCTLLESAAKAGAPERESIDEIAESVERAAALTRQLLAFGRRQTLRARAVDPNEPALKMGKMLRRVIPERIEIEVSPSARPLRVHADPAMLEQVVMNLVLNARDAIEGKGRIVVRTTDADGVDPGTRAPASPHGWATLRVSDDGRGIAEKDLPRIFEPFFTTKPLGRGTGLGLSVVDGIVRQHKGWVEVESRVGRGTAVTVYLPRRPDEAPGVDVSRSNGAPRGEETILLAEDEAALRRLCVRCLSTLGYRVIEAASGEAALERWSREKDAVDLLVTDMVMPGIDGGELSRRLRAESPELKTVYISGYHAAASDEDRRGPNSAFLQKPFHPDELARLVRTTLDRA